MKFITTNFADFCEVHIPEILSKYKFNKEATELVQKAVILAGRQVIVTNLARRKKQELLPTKVIRFYVGFSLYHFFKAQEKMLHINFAENWKFKLQNENQNKISEKEGKLVSELFESKVTKSSEISQAIARTYFEGIVAEKQYQKVITSIINSVKSASDVETLIGSTQANALSRLGEFITVMLDDVVGGKTSIGGLH